ncbi:MAG: SOS response-associated peptidase [Rhodanobacter sp.]
MCGRYSLFGPVSLSRAAKAALAQLDVDMESALNQREPQYNIAPTQKAPILAHAEGAYAVQATRWGLIPSWAKDDKIGSKLINARVETVAEKPSFRAAFKKRRCLVPASGYFEWKGEAGHKQPYFIHDPAGDLLLFAGLWEGWKPANEAEWLHTFTIITGEPGKVSGDIHDRQPVILPPESWQEWLTDVPDVAADVLHQAPEADLKYYAVPKAVGSPRNRGPELVRPIAA